ncbi:MAG TPA: hypothetical protein VD969_15240 [Symbiobacteriaceae bacterium]|nr:hypothetical protein [Symbiobacteriaceae bacterium]
MGAWLRERWLALAAGVLLWGAVALAATLYANQRDISPWHRVVTWDEWLVAIGLLVCIVVPRRLAGWMGMLPWALLVVFALDLLTRAVLGLGWVPF